MSRAIKIDDFRKAAGSLFLHLVDRESFDALSKVGVAAGRWKKTPKVCRRDGDFEGLEIQAGEIISRNRKNSHGCVAILNKANERLADEIKSDTKVKALSPKLAESHFEKMSRRDMVLEVGEIALSYVVISAGVKFRAREAKRMAKGLD